MYIINANSTFRHRVMWSLIAYGKQVKRKIGSAFLKELMRVKDEQRFMPLHALAVLATLRK